MELLLVEDDRTLALVLADLLRDAGHQVTVLHDGAAAVAWLEGRRCDAVITDVRLPGADGTRVLGRARAQDPPADVLVMTGYATVQQAVECMRGGAITYLQKPFPAEAVLAHVARVEQMRRLAAELERLRAGGDAGDLGLTGASPAMEDLRARVRAAARFDATVLLWGESGTGKERAARAVHRASPRCGQPFVAVGCAAVPESLFEGELFGFRRGAFTGADADHPGFLEQAGAGTVFLDDVDDLTASAQAALLRVLQEREFQPLGATESLQMRARVIAATRSDLRQVAGEGRFREDLYYRLAVVPIRMPPLRERLEDLPLLLAEFLRARDPQGRFEVAPEALQRLVQHDWPGNARELENAVDRALALAGGARILRQEHFFPGGPLAVQRLRPQDVPPLRESVRRAERDAIRSALSATGGRRAEAARLMGISRKALWQKLKELGLEGGGAG